MNIGQAFVIWPESRLQMNANCSLTQSPQQIYKVIIHKCCVYLKSVNTSLRTMEEQFITSLRFVHTTINMSKISVRNCYFSMESPESVDFV